MKTIFTIQLYTDMQLSLNICAMLANNNSERVEISFPILKGYIKAYGAQYPILLEATTLHENVKNASLTLFDKNDKPLFIIYEKHLYDLDESVTAHALALTENVD